LTGRVVSTLPVPYPGTRGESPRDVEVDINGDLHVLNGTSEPYLSTYRRATLQWEHRRVSSWSIYPNLTTGQIGFFGGYAFVPSMVYERRSIRFDTTSNDVAYFGTIVHTRAQITVGRDGLVYAIEGERSLSVFDPRTLQALRTIPLTTLLYGVAVDRDGATFGGSPDGYLYKLDGNGQMVARLFLSRTSYSHIAIDAEGNIVLGNSDDEIVLTDVRFSKPRRYAWNWTSHPYVSFADPRRSAVLPGSETVVTGTPPNPPGLTASSGQPPGVGRIWTPTVTPVLPNADGIFLLISARQTNEPTSMGTLLADLGALVYFDQLPTGRPFRVPVPDAWPLIGTRLIAQAGSFLVGTKIQLTNGLALVIGSF